MANVALISEFEEHLSIKAMLERDTHKVILMNASEFKEGITWPELVVLNVGCVTTNHVSLICSLRIWFQQPICLVASRASMLLRSLALDAGADDCMRRRMSPVEFRARIRARLRRHNFERPTVLQFGDVLISMNDRSVARAGKPVDLTPTEFELLAALVRGNGSVVDRRDLLRDVWRFQRPTKTRTIDFHVNQLRRKLEVGPKSPELILTVRARGFRLASL